MSRLLGIFFLLLQATSIFAQEKETAIPRQILSTAEQEPEFPGGLTALKRYMVKNIRYPKESYKNNVEGQVIVRFVVEIDGSCSNIEVIQSVDAWCDEEAIRVIRKMPDWNPGRQNGAAVAVYYQIPVSFKLH